jgi:hypothetical protein
MIDHDDVDRDFNVNHNVLFTGRQNEMAPTNRLTTTATATKPNTSWFHCVGDNWEPNAYVYRSCQFHHLCWSTSTTTRNGGDGADGVKNDIHHRLDGGKFVLFASSTQQELDYHLSHVWQHPYARISTSTSNFMDHRQPQTNPLQQQSIAAVMMVSPIGQTLWWSRKRKYAWFPTMIINNHSSSHNNNHHYDHDHQATPIQPQQQNEQQQQPTVLLLPEATVWIPIYVPPMMVLLKKKKKQSHNSNQQYRVPSVWTILTETILPMFQILEMFYPHHLNQNTTQVMVQILNRRQLQHDSQPQNSYNTIDFTMMIHQPNQSATAINTTSFSTNSASCWDHAPCQSRYKMVMSTFMAWDIWDESMITTMKGATKPITSNQAQSPSPPLLNASSALASMSNVLICGKGVAGMGSLTDHGWIKRHGQQGKDYRTVHNVGRGKMWWDFRNYILIRNQQQPRKQEQDQQHNLDFVIQWAMPQHQQQDLTLPAFKALFNKHLISQDIGGASTGKQQENTATTPPHTSWNLQFPPDDEKNTMMATMIKLYNMNQACACQIPTTVQHNHQDDNNMNYQYNRHQLTECIHQASRSNIYITAASNGDEEDRFGVDSSCLLWPALLLPRGATLLLYYDETQVVPITKRQSRPRMLHFDVWNNLSHLRVHWLPLPTTKTSTIANNNDDMNVLIHLIDIELQAVVRRSKPTKKETIRPPDGRWNGMNLYRITTATPPSSQVHCVGDNFLPWESYIYQSCYMQHLCLDLQQEKNKNASVFFLTTSQRQEQFAQLLRSWNRSDASISTEARVFRKRMAVGHNVRLSDGKDWFPQIRGSEGGTIRRRGQYHYWELDSNVVWLPFVAEQPNINNPGHLLWDFILPMFTLLSMFDLENKTVLLTNLEHECSNGTPCYNHITKFLLLLGVPPTSFSNVWDSQLESNLIMEDTSPRIVCARQAVAGMGMLTDHGLKRHGQGIDDYNHVHNVGRGAHFYQFRNHILRHMGIVQSASDRLTTLKKPYQTVFSVNSSKNPSRRRDFSKQVAMVRASFSQDELLLKEVSMSQLPLSEQLQLVTETSIFVSVIGGATSTATFLPAGSSIVLFFNDMDDFVDNVKDGRPNMMDWDFWNNASYLRVHWLPIKSMDEVADLESFRLLIQHEISILSN